jgi:hypothetical protein
MIIEISIHDQRTRRHIHFFVAKKVNIVDKWLVLLGNVSSVIIEKDPHFPILKGVLPLSNAGIVSRLAVPTVPHHRKQLIKLTVRLNGVLRWIEKFLPLQPQVNLDQVSLWGKPKLLHMNDQNVGHLIDQVFQVLIFMLALVAFHLHVLGLVVLPYTRLKAHEFILTGVLDITRYQIHFDIRTKHWVAFREIYPIDENWEIIAFRWPK